MLQLDNNICNYILDNTDIFKNIHPNYITIAGLGLNCLIYEELINKQNKNWNKLAIFMGLRWFADSLDGNMARKYNKQSKLGNILDTSSDILLQAVFIYFIYIQLKNERLKQILIFAFIIYIYTLISKFKLFDNHDTVKTGNDFISVIIKSIVHNTIILFMIIFYGLQNLNIPKLENNILQLISK